MLEDGLSYPTRGEWTGRLIIGSMLALFGVLLLPVLLVYGYWFRALRTSVNGEPEPPAWDRWTKLAIDGAKAYVVSIAYALVPNLIGGVVLLVMFAVLAGGEPTAETGGLLAGIGLVGGIVVFLVNLLVLFVLPAAMVTFAAEDSARAAFSFGRVASFAFSAEYLLALFHMLFVLTFATIVAATGVLAPPAIFWTGLALARIFGTAYRESVAESGRRPTESQPTQSQPTDSQPTQSQPRPGTDEASGPTGATGTRRASSTTDRTAGESTAANSGASRDGSDDSTAQQGRQRSTEHNRPAGESGSASRSGDAGRRSGGEERDQESESGEQDRESDDETGDGRPGDDAFWRDDDGDDESGSGGR